jgi:fibronectin type 3 domain-containing protein
MKQLILPILAATFILFSGCAKQPTAPVEPVIDSSLPKVSVNGHIESMTTIAFEWKPLQDPRVKGYFVYRNNPEAEDKSLQRIATVQGRFVSHLTDTDLQAGTTYVYRFSSFNEKMQESDASKTFRVTTLPVLESVSFFDSIGNLPRMAKLIWRPHDDPSVKSYILERQTIEKAEWVQIATIKNRLNAEYIDTGLDNNRVYKYRLRAVTFEDIKSTPSTIVKVVTKPLPQMVQNLQATTAEPKKIRISWNENSENDLAFYNIYRSDSSNGNYDYYVKLNETEFTDEINEDGKNYFYQITAVDKDGLESPFQTNPVHGSTLAKPLTPSFIDAIVKNNAAVLRWKNNDKRTKSYTVIKTTKESWISSTVQEITGIIDTSYTVKDLKPDVQYQFQIMAVDTYNITSKPTEPADVLFSTPNR